MSGNNLEHLILNSIEQLRERKSRPDFVRICHMLERKHGVNSGDVEAELKRLVDENIVIKVGHKGGNSYRNVSKLDRHTNKQRIEQLNSIEMSKTLTDIVSELSSKKAELGVSIEEIENTITSPNLDFRLSRNELEIALEREVSIGALQKLISGDFVLVSPRSPQKNSNSVHFHRFPSQNGVELRRKQSGIKRQQKISHRFRTRGRKRQRKQRFRKTLGSVHVEWSPPTWSDRELALLKCNFCMLPASAHPEGDSEFLICFDCGARASTKCMDYSPELAGKARLYPWQCMYCKTCCLCNDSDDWDTMLICDACDKGYHMKCHVPIVTEEPTGTWICQRCMNEKQTTEADEINDKNSVVNSNQLGDLGGVNTSLNFPLLCDSPVPHDYGTCTNTFDTLNRNHFETYPEVVPDAKDWTIDDVENFFTHIGFPEQAPAFREQE
ncbi:histone acetyltransferase KAT6A-like isoform X3 [Tachypleus tridentatus]